MPAGYTQSIEDEYWNYTKQVAAQSRRRIENFSEAATEDQWKQEFEAIGREQCCSARFFIMS